jgi:DNA replication protein DnaC
MNAEEAKQHPMFHILSMALGPEKALKAVMQAVGEQERKNQATTEFSKETKKIILPSSMNKLQGSKELERQWKDEETKINVDRIFADWNWKDVLVATKKAAERHFGWIQGKEGMFGQKPREIEVTVDIKEGKAITETCFYGKFTASVWEDATVDVGPSYLTCEVKKRYADDVREFFNLVQEILNKESIFRGKAITVTRKSNPWGAEDSLNFDIFEMNCSDKIVLNDDIKGIVKNFIIDDLGEEGKRCYLFSGSYGNGKTEVAMQVGREGIKKGMAFFYCKDADMFPMLLGQAINYNPALVFLEDIDEIGSGSDRGADMNKILNTLDGVQSKGKNLTVIFTTNHEKRINPALRRPGRIDLVVNFGNPNKDSVAQIYSSYFKDLAGQDTLDYMALAENTPDCPGAVIAEIAKRAHKLCVKRGGASNELVKAAVDSMSHHLKLMKEDVEEPKHGNMTITVSGAAVKIAENVESLVDND